MSLEVAVLASGSSGNSIYVSGRETSILIDAGLSGKKIADNMKQVGCSPDELKAILLTHEHRDHISGAGVMARRYDLPIYASQGTLRESRDKLGRLGRDQLKAKKGNWELQELKIETFALPHDAAEPTGYVITSGDVMMAAATDIGCVTAEIMNKLSGADILVLESNHDLDLLRTGSYPPSLKKRIRSDRGHLSNIEAAGLLPELIKDQKNERPIVILGHLSEENNRPELAYLTVKNSLNSRGWQVGEDVLLNCASREEPGELYRLKSSPEGGISKTG